MSPSVNFIVVQTLRDQWIRSLRVASRNVDFDEKYEILEAIG